MNNALKKRLRFRSFERCFLTEKQLHLAARMLIEARVLPDRRSGHSRLGFMEEELAHWRSRLPVDAPVESAVSL